MTVTESLPVQARAVRLGYVPALDGVRALAIALVAVYHGVMPAHFGGAGGVDVFFVLSGFLITTLLLEEREATGGVSLRRFYVRRAIRLYPPLLLMLAVVFIPIAITMGVTTATTGSTLSLFYLMPLGAESGSTTLSPYEHAWSLGVEEWFYFVWPPALVWLLAKPANRKRAALIAASAATAVLAVAAFLAEARAGEVSFILRACGLMAGSVLALGLHGREFRVGRWVGVAGVALFGFSLLRSTLAPFSTIDVFSADAGALLLVVAIVRGPQGLLRRVLSLPPMTYIGRISYEIYLWHYPILCLFGIVAGTDFLGVGWAALPVSLLLAAAAHRLTQPLTSLLRARMAARNPA